MEITSEAAVKEAVVTVKTKIVCQVHNCLYNDGFCNCMRNSIDIGKYYAKSDKDLSCRSFTPRTL
jgi:hypothetical protein